jgi:Cu/Zn superoxide dismutase
MFNMRRILTVGFILALGTALVATPADADKAQAQIQTNSINAVFTFESSKEGVRLTARAEGLASQEEYAYHIHEKPVPSSGSCSETGGHLDPFNRTSSAVCTPTTPEKCEMGDLSGKWGKLKTNNRGVVDPVRHIDPTLSLNGEHSIIGLSVVMHNSKGERIAVRSKR